MINVLRQCRAICALTLSALLLHTQSHAQVRILFDATKGEMAGNADWVIDFDQTNLGVGSSGVYTTSSGHQSNPQQVPTPAQSGITASTSESYWTGALSAWAVDCVKKGYTVETLPWNGQITYGNTSNAQDLANYKVYVIDEPNLQFSTDEKTAIIQFVQHGGGLFIVSDHTGSDRNGDGWDSPAIWNDLFSTNSVATNPFGITFDLSDFSQATTNIISSGTDPILHGPMGNVTQAQWSGGTSMTLNTSANPSVKGVIYKTGASQGNSSALVAYGTYGTGRFAAMGDSSPTDDGTGNPGCTLYTGYTGDAAGNHRLLIMNMTIWLAGGTTAVNSTLNEPAHVSIYPNPGNGMMNITTDKELTNVVVTVCDMTGNVVKTATLGQLNKNSGRAISLPPGCYAIRVVSDEITEVNKVIIY